MADTSTQDGVTTNHDGSVTVKLKYPVENAGVKTDTLTFRRPKNKDYLLLDKQKGSERQRNNWLMVHLSECDPAVVEELDVYDMAIINAVFADFLPDSYRPAIFG